MQKKTLMLVLLIAYVCCENYQSYPVENLILRGEQLDNIYEINLTAGDSLQYKLHHIDSFLTDTTGQFQTQVGYTV